MNTDIYTLEEIKEKLFPIFKHYHVKKAFVFGSYSKNCAVKESDVDIFLDSGLHGLAFVELIEDIRNALDKTVDVIDKRQVDENSIIKSEILKYGELIYEE